MEFITDFVNSLLPKIENIGVLGYWVAFLSALLETIIGIGLFIPGSTIVLFMGALAAKNYFDLGDLIWFAAIGAMVGDNINYFIGKRYGSRFFTKGLWFIEPIYFLKGKEFFRHHGAKSVFLGRFIPSLKEVAPLIAGVFKMKRSTFLIWNTLGAIGWSLAWVLPGYFFTQSLNLAEVWINRIGLFLGALLVIYAFYFVWKNKL